MPTLVVLTPRGKKKQVPLKSQGISIIGRRPDCDIRVPLSYVSRKHCQIKLTPESAVLQDLGSSNGTFVNRQKIVKTTINHGDTITIGNINFTYLADNGNSNPGNSASGSYANLNNDAIAAELEKSIQAGPDPNLNPNPNPNPNPNDEGFSDDDLLEELGFPESEIDPNSPLR